MATTNSSPICIRIPNIDRETFETCAAAGGMSNRDLLMELIRLLENGDLEVGFGSVQVKKVYTPKQEVYTLDMSRLEDVAAQARKTPQQVLDMMLNKYAGG